MSTPEEGYGLDTQLKKIVHRTARIRKLSSPQIEDVPLASGYGALLKSHFQEIGLLAADNREMLEMTVYPLLEKKEKLTDEEMNSLGSFCMDLLNGQDLCDLDQSLVYRVSRRLLEERILRGEDAALVRQLDIHISSCYEMMHQTKRMRTAGDLSAVYREEGLAAAQQIWGYLDKEKFARLDEESKELVLINSRYAVYLYETDYMTEGVNDRFLDLLQKAYELADDPFYTTQAPSYDWNYHKIRCMEYMGQTTECGNLRRFTQEQCLRVSRWLDVGKAIWEQDAQNNEEILPRCCLDLICGRNEYYAGKRTLQSYRKLLREIWYGNRNTRYDFNSVFPNLQVPMELIISYDGQDRYDEREHREIEAAYAWVIGYVFHATNGEAFSLLMEYFSELIYHYIELPGGMSFERMGLYCMAALHPPTYIHSLSVGELSRCICKHLLRRKPELFADLPEYVGVTGTERATRIETLCYHAALCHDFGKLPMIDTIFVYGRRLLDPEYALLKHHPRVGADLLARHASTRRYADVARGHHKWHDNSSGYPEEFDSCASPDHILIDIVEIADCLDAATDTVGRSYSGGKSPAEILAEIREQSGSRYSPEIAQMLGESEVQSEIIEILQYGREENYRNTYNFLRDILERGLSGGISTTQDDLKLLYEMLTEAEHLHQAYLTLNYDLQTVCPPKGQEEAGTVLTALAGAEYRIKKRESFIGAVERLYAEREQLDEWDVSLVGHLHRDILREKQISSDRQEMYENANRQAGLAWHRAREANDFALFADALKMRRDLAVERVNLWEPEAVPYAKTAYDRMLDEYETGMTTERLDGLFASCKERIRRIMDAAMEKQSRIRTDFLRRTVTDAQQTRMTEVLLDLMGFDRTRGTWGFSTHPFTERLGVHDTRVTTHFEQNDFLSNFYTILHECGHALFEQLQPEENHTRHIADQKTMGQHECVSRFYENIIGRSRAFIRMIYPTVCEIFPEVMADVSEQELYEAVNQVKPSLIRMDADELTYTLHIVIRYELEREMIDEGLDISRLREAWAQKYQAYLGIAPEDDRSGILQDIHWTDSFGYFPTYALGNLYGGMILKRMQESFDPFASLSTDGFSRINAWMREEVFARADRSAPAVWIREICRRELTAEDYLNYLEEKYMEAWGTR